MSEETQEQDVNGSSEKQVTLLNKGLATHIMPGPDGTKLVLAPGKTVTVPESVAKRYTGPGGYRDIVDASTLVPGQTTELAKLREENAALQERLRVMTSTAESAAATLEAHNAQVVELGKEIDAIKAQVENLTEEKSVLEADLEKAQAKGKGKSKD